MEPKVVEFEKISEIGRHSRETGYREYGTFTCRDVFFAEIVCPNAHENNAKKCGFFPHSAMHFMSSSVKPSQFFMISERNP